MIRQQCLLALRYSKQAVAVMQAAHGKDTPLHESTAELYAQIYAQVGKLSYECM